MAYTVCIHAHIYIYNIIKLYTYYVNVKVSIAPRIQPIEFKVFKKGQSAWPLFSISTGANSSLKSISTCSLHGAW